MIRFVARTSMATLAALVLGLGADSASAAIITVTTNANTGGGSLRQAIIDANLTPAFDEIRFNLPANQRTITPTTSLPLLTTSIDVNGTSQPGYAGVPLVAINGATAGGTGLRFLANLSSVRGLAIHGFSVGVRMEGNLCVVKSNYIGLTAAGAGGFGNTSGGLAIDGSFDTVGGSTAADRNVISGNGNNGIDIGADAASNLIYGNYIGTNVAGDAAIGNGGYGIRSFGSGNQIGSNLAGAGNLISGNGRGVSLEADDAIGSSLRGNIIGLNAAGTAKLTNHGSGLELHSSANEIGGTSVGDRNVISGNDYSGITISEGKTGNLIQGNYVGTDVTGTVALGNVGAGIDIDGFENVVGGVTAAAANLISGNGGGIYVAGDENNIQGNRIGTNASGTAALGNVESGVRLYGMKNKVGGTAAGSGNQISGNGTGLHIIDGVGNVIEGNRMGTNPTGTAAVANGSYAIRLIGATGNTIGGSAAGAGNLMSGNGRGIAFDDDAPGNILQGNIIGLAADGQAPLGNGSSGIEIGSADNLIGGGDPGTGNIIASNQYYGIIFQGPTATGNLVQGNKIGVASDGTTLRGNYYNLLFYGASGNTIGGSQPGEGNIIAGSVNAGAYVWFGTHNDILGNSFFSNGGLGIDLEPQGLAASDPLDADTGSNEGQNIPVLTSALAGGGQLAIQGTLASQPSTSYHVEFFSSPACDPSGFGEGRTFLGAATVVSNASGVATIASSVPFSGGDTAITATATSPEGDTSEFSPCATVGIGANAGALQFSQAQFLGYEELGSVTILVARTGGATGAVTVHYATSDDTATAPADYKSTSGTLSFADGEVVKSFNVPLILDAPDGDQQINLTLTNPTGAATLGAQATSHVLLFDYSTAFPGVFISDVTLFEGDNGTKNANFVVTLTPTDHVVTFDVRTTGGTATDGVDYDDQEVSLIFNAGDPPKTVSVPIHGDVDVEGTEVFFMQASGQILPSGYAGNVGHGYILDDDGPTLPLADCGNGVVQEPETCDDGDLLYALGDFCSASCVAFSCGVPTKVDGTPKASDALFVLKAAVQGSNCDKKICDANGSNTVTASDALLILKDAVGQNVTLQCPE